MARTDDEFVSRLVTAGLAAFGRLAPGGNRVTATRGTAFTTTVRVINRVHRDAAYRRALAHVTLAAGFAENRVGMVCVRTALIQLVEHPSESGQPDLPERVLELSVHGEKETSVSLSLTEIRKLKRLLSEGEQRLLLRYEQDMKAKNMELAF